MASDIVAVAIVERDLYGECLAAWTYPILPDGVEPVVLRRAENMLGSLSSSANPADAAGEAYLFSKFKGTWLYTLAAAGNLPSTALPSVSGFAICLVCRTFNPEKYGGLLREFCARYASTGESTKVLEGYLSVFTTGALGDAWKNDDPKWDDNRALIANSSIIEVVSTFGMESILLWNALILKKRLFVYSDDTAQLMRIVRTLPQFAWHRRNWELLRPFVMLDHADEVADLRSAGVFIAGITDKDALRANAADMCDVLVDMTERSIIVSPSAKDDMAVTKELHKEIAEYMVASAKDGTEQNLIKRILNRTSQLIGASRSSAAAMAK